MANQYNDIPTLDQWKRDSSVTLATRASDTVLSRIDELVTAVNRAGDAGARAYLVGDLFFTLDYWLKDYKTGRGMEKGREPAVMALYKYVVEELGDTFGQELNGGKKITPNNLPAALETFYGRTLGGHGAKLDLRLDCAIYLSRAEVAKYRVCFKDGKAYQSPWWEGKSRKSVVLANSKHAENPGVLGRPDWGGFAMSMSRDLYMAKHHCTKNFGEEGNFYHSSYLAGQPVLCSGTMLIKNGVISGIATDSGHFRPGKGHVVNVLQALKMQHVDLSKIQVRDHSLKFQAWGHNFLAAQGNWAKMLEQNQLNEDHMDARRKEEKAFGDTIKEIWDHGVQGGYYIDDMPSKLHFVTHVLPLRKKVLGQDTEGLDFLYALDALAKATSRASDPNADWDAWCLQQWREFIKGDTTTRRDGMANKESNIPQFVDWVKRRPEFVKWTRGQIHVWVKNVLQKSGHRFDA